MKLGGVRWEWSWEELGEGIRGKLKYILYMYAILEELIKIVY